MSSSQRQVQPNMQKRFTNIAVVRYKKNGKKFEVACYKNKIFNYREGVEENLDDVLQTEDIYKDISTGDRANIKDLKSAFKKEDKFEIIKYILKKGEIQLSKKEREFIIEKKRKEIINFIAQTCLNPLTQRQYPFNIIEQEIKNIHFNVKMEKPSKTQALACIKKLKKTIDIVRARMRIRIKFNKAHKKTIGEMITKNEENCKIEKENYNEKDETKTILLLIDPFLFRPFRNIICENSGDIEIIDAIVQEEDEIEIDDVLKDVQIIEKNKNEEEDDENEEMEGEEKNTKKKKKEKNKVKNKGNSKGGREKKKISRSERRKKRKEKKKNK